MIRTVLVVGVAACLLAGDTDQDGPGIAEGGRWQQPEGLFGRQVRGLRPDRVEGPDQPPSGGFQHARRRRVATDGVLRLNDLKVTTVAIQDKIAILRLRPA